jgi:hypothetical protein
MKTLMRLLALGAFIAILGFCVFGFIATFEPMPTIDRVIWRTVYSLAGIAIILGLFRLLRCQCLHWFKRHSHSDPATQN